MKPTREQMLQWVENWHIAGEAMREMRRADLLQVDVAHAMAMLDDAYESARMTCEPRMTSGLVEQQKWFSKRRV